MTAQPEALRLADALEISSNHGIRREAAAELRRLHGLDFALRDCELALNKMAKKYMDASDQRDALLEALKAMLNMVERHAPVGLAPTQDSPVAKARAAIAKAEVDA